MNLIRLSLLAVFISILSSAGAQQDNVSINSYTIKKSDAQSVTVEVSYNYDGSKGSVLLDASAKSRDGTVRAFELERGFVNQGKNITTTASFRRPPDNEVQKTDILRLKLVSQKNGAVVASRDFDLPYVWEATSLPMDETISKYKYVNLFESSFVEGDFAAIDQLLDKLISSELTDASGNWELSSFSYVMQMQFNGKNDQDGLKRIQKWKKLNPKSTGPSIAEAIYWQAAAWRIRGSEANLNVDPLAMKLFKQKMDTAELALSSAKSYASRDPSWYEMYLSIAQENSKSLAFTEKLFQEAINRHPHFPNLYEKMALVYAPRYGVADWIKVDKIVETAVKNIHGASDAAVYASIYQRIALYQEIDFEIFRDSLASWPKIKQGYEDRLKKKQSTILMNEMAVYACRANDKDTFNKLWVQIQDKLERESWPSNYTPDICKYRFNGKM